MKNQPKFKLTKIMDQGTDNPIFKRFVLQFNEIFKTNCIDIPEKTIAKINDNLFECARDMVRVEEILKKYIEVEDNAIKKLQDGTNVRIENNTIFFDDPTFELEKQFEDFLIRSIVVLRRLKTIIELIVGKEIKEHKKLYSELESYFCDDKETKKMLESDKEWYKELYDFRGIVEHSKLPIRHFDVVHENGVLTGYQMASLIEKKCSIREYMEVTFYNVFSYCEDYVAALIRKKCHTWVQIHHVNPEENDKGYAYIISISESTGEMLNTTT